jgi:outer membrane protein OmpA-like peptidoglycan-associated protein
MLKIDLKILITLALVLLANTYLFGQSEKLWINKGQDAIKNENYTKALEYFLNAHEINPDNAGTNFEIGLLYLDGIYKFEALPYLEKAYSLNPKIDPQIHFFLGNAYHFDHLWDKAIEQYELAKGTLPKDDPRHAQVPRLIEECNNGKEYEAQINKEMTIVHLGNHINTKYPEYAPIITANESMMIFTSRREGSTGGELDDEENYFEDIYMSKKVNGVWQPPVDLGPTINTDGHDASIGLSADGTEMFIYKDEGTRDIYLCTLQGGDEWTKPERLSDVINSKKTYENAATISSNKRMLIFTSDREGTVGDLDLWMSFLDGKGEWGKPVNLGANVNTIGAEEAPFLDFDDVTLYFASTHHKGIGGFDIYKTVYDSIEKKWSDPVNIGMPVNSADDDLFFTVSGDGRHGYFSSVKKGGTGEKDIYMITLPERNDIEELMDKMAKMKLVVPEPIVAPIVTAAVVPVKKPVVLQGIVKEANSGKPLAVTIIIENGAGQVIQTIQSGTDGSFYATFRDTINQNIVVLCSSSGFNPASKTVQIPAMSFSDQNVNTELILSRPVVGSVFTLRNIYYDFDKYSIRKDSEKELNKVLNYLKQNPNVRLEIGSHTDSYGSNAYNINLAQKRAQSVVNWLVAKGIEKSRMEWKGFGEEVPLATNDDETEGRELNRRTEFKVIK